MNTQARQRGFGERGFNMIELMIGLAIVAIVLMFGVPSLGAWIQSYKIRNASESVLTALQLARAEAVRRNTSVQLVFTASPATDWKVGCVTTSTTCPDSIQARSAAEGSANVTLSSSQTSFVFSGLGRLTPVPAADLTLNFSNTENDCLAQDGTGTYRCLRIVVTPGGQARMCDPAVASTNPRAC